VRLKYRIANLVVWLTVGSSIFDLLLRVNRQTSKWCAALTQSELHALSVDSDLDSIIAIVRQGI